MDKQPCRTWEQMREMIMQLPPDRREGPLQFLERLIQRELENRATWAILRVNAFLSEENDK